jgi:hypothetical protein
MANTEDDKQKRLKAWEVIRENHMRIDAILFAALAAGFGWLLFNGLLIGSAEILGQVLPKILAIVYALLAGIGILFLIMYRATMGKTWFERFVLPENLHGDHYSAYLYGIVSYIIVAHTIIVPMSFIPYFATSSISAWVMYPIGFGVIFGYMYFTIKFLPAFAKWLGVKTW